MKEFLESVRPTDLLTGTPSALLLLPSVTTKSPAWYSHRNGVCF